MTVEFLWSFPTCSVVIYLTTLQMKWSLPPLVVWAFKLLFYSYASFSFAFLESKKTELYFWTWENENSFVRSQVKGAKDLCFSIIRVIL